MDERCYERDLKLDLVVTQGGRSGQRRNLIEGTGELLCGLREGRPF
jgi:hypothetical protein